MHREDFPMLKQDIIYLDNGATTFKPQVVIDAITDYYTNYTANAHRGDYAISYKVDVEYEGARKKIAKFINANPEEIIFTSGTTEGINMIVSGFFDNLVEPGDEILLTKSEHASNVLPWYRLANKHNLKINYIPLDANLHVTMESLKSVVTPRTKIIALAELTNVVGDIRPIKEICEYAHQNNIFIVCDGAQSVPHKPTDVQDMDVDFLVFSAHKMCGPTGIGALYAKKELLESFDPLNLGGGISQSFDNEKEVVLKEIPHRLEAGTPNISGAIGFGAAVEYLSNIGMDKIMLYEQKLKKYLVDGLMNIPHIDIVNEEAGSGIVSFNVEGVFPQDVASYLNKYNVCVRSGSHCAKILKAVTGIKNTIRASLYFYNNEADIDALLELLSDKDKILKEML